MQYNMSKDERDRMNKALKEGKVAHVTHKGQPYRVKYVGVDGSFNTYPADAPKGTYENQKRHDPTRDEVHDVLRQLES